MFPSFAYMHNCAIKIFTNISICIFPAGYCISNSQTDAHALYRQWEADTSSHVVGYK